MDWSALIGRRRPVESDALRLAILVHQLGEPGDEPTPKRVQGEDLLQILDHLLRHPTTLAYVLMDQVARRRPGFEARGVFARRVRQLLSNERQQHQPTRRRRPWQTKPDGPVDLTLHPFTRPRWQRLDEPLTLLAARDLMRVRLRREERPLLSYELTARGVDWLESEIYPKDRNSTLYLQLCSIMLDLLPALDGPGWRDLMDEIRHHLDAFRRDERLPVEQDPLAVLFHHVFQEHL